MKNFYILIIILILYTINIYIDKNFIATESKMIDFLAKNYPSSIVQSYVESQKKWWWVSYVVNPFIIGCKVLFTAFCLNFIKIIDIENTDNIEFSDIVFIVLLAEIVFVLAGFYKFVNFYFIDTNYKLEDLQTYYPISLLNIREYISMERWLTYPLQTANLFEVFYWGILVWGVKELLDNKISYICSLKYVAMTYGIGLFFWISIICFLIINAQY